MYKSTDFWTDLSLISSEGDEGRACGRPAPPNGLVPAPLMLLVTSVAAPKVLRDVELVVVVLKWLNSYFS